MRVQVRFDHGQLVGLQVVRHGELQRRIGGVPVEARPRRE